MTNERGFTLIELLTVVAIVGILAAVAIPQFAEYKVRAFNARAQTDLRNGLTAEEAYFVDNESYASCSDAACSGLLPGFRLSGGVHVSYAAKAGDEPLFAGSSCHPKGNRHFNWNQVSNVMTSAKSGACTAAPSPSFG